MDALGAPYAATACTSGGPQTFMFPRLVGQRSAIIMSHLLSASEKFD